MMVDVPVAASDDPVRFALVSMISAAAAMQTSLAVAVRRYDDAASKRKRTSSFFATESELPPSERRSTPQTPRRSAPSSGDGDGLKLGERQMLGVLLSLHPRAPSRAELGALVGIRARGTTFGRYLSTLRGRGFVVTEGTEVRATEAGRAAGAFAPVSSLRMTREYLVSVWRPKLKLGERLMLQAVASCLEGGLTRAVLASVAEVDPQGTTFGRYLSTLRGADLVVIDKGRGGLVRPGPALAHASVVASEEEEETP